MKQIFYKLVALMLAVFFAGGAILLGEKAFNEVLDFRKLERIPLSTIQASVGGESQLHGIAQPTERTLKAPKTGVRTIYYEYLLERREVDSDGDESWVTERHVRDIADFYIDDGSGRAFVRAHESQSRIDYSIQEKFYRREGDYRHTEWRVDPGDPVTIYAWLTYAHEPIVDFHTPGHYVPIISSFSGGSERSRVARSAILFLWGAVSCVLFVCFLMVYVFRFHKTLVFLVLVSLSSAILLFHYGYRSVVADVVDGYDRVESHWHRANSLVNDRLQSHGLLPMGLETPIDLTSLAYSELDEVDRIQVDAWRLSAYQVRQRYMQQIDQIPERWVANQKKMHEPPAVAIPAVLEAEAARLMAEYQATQIGDKIPVLWLLPVLLIVTGGLAWFSFGFIRVKRMQENIPTSKTAGVVYGLAEVKGTLVAEDKDKTLSGPVTGEACCWYHYVVKEKQGSGKDSRWVVIEDEIKKQPFYCEDDEGRIRIFPGRADCISEHVESEHRGNRHYTETRLSPGDELYVLGKAKPDKTKGDSLVFSFEKDSPYIIANVSEDEVMFRKASRGIGLLAMALSVLFLGSLFTLGMNGQMSSLDFLLAGLVSPIFMLFVIFVLMYNDLIFLQQRCDRNWANIQVSLKKRADLVPQLQEVVGQYLKHEQSLQEDLAKLRELRRSATSAAEVDAYLDLEHSVIGGINVAVENYPDLEGIDLIGVFNNRLIRLENEIALIRAGFNDAVTEYQIRSQSFPDSLLANMFGFRPITLLTYTENAHRLR